MENRIAIVLLLLAGRLFAQTDPLCESRNMPPIYVVNNIMYRDFANFEQFGQILLHDAVSDCGSNVNNIRCSELAVMMAFSASDFVRINDAPVIVTTNRVLATFVNHIGGVIGNCSKEQMCWIYAERIITFMQDALPLWNRPIVDQPRHAMSNLRVVLNRPRSVSSGICATSPIPTTPKFGTVGLYWSVFIYLSEEALKSDWREIDFLCFAVKSAVRFWHNGISVMSEFSNGRSATTDAHYEFKEVA